MPNWIQIETRGGDPISSNGITLTPFARSVRIQFPGLHGGIIWNRPVSVLALYPDGHEDILPVQDETRRVQFALLGAGLFSGIFMWLISRRKRKQPLTASS
jgi:hypothetical protein